MSFIHYDLEKLVPSGHALRRFKERLPVREIAEKREELKKSLGREGYGMEAGLRGLFLQFWGDFSDRQMEEQLRFNMGYRWFCGFDFDSVTPDHTFFCRVRKNMGADSIGELFSKIVQDAQLRKIIKKLESFVDASAIRRKEAEWEKRDADRAKEEAEEQADRKKQSKESANTSERVKQFSSDTEGRWGCKGKKKYWFGYKRHVAVDMGSGFIEAVETTPANVNDDQAFWMVCPWDKRVIADKAYDTWKVYATLKRRGCGDEILRKKTRKDYNGLRNKLLSKKRAPWEHVFSKMSKRTRYMGLARTRLQVFMEAIVHNLKRLFVLESPIPVRKSPIPLIGLS